MSAKQSLELVYQKNMTFFEAKGYVVVVLKRDISPRNAKTYLHALHVNVDTLNHTVLPDPTKSLVNFPTIDRYSINQSDSSNVSAGDHTSSMAITFIRLKLKSKNHSFITYTFFHSGGSVNFCSENTVRQLGASGQKCNITDNMTWEMYQLTPRPVKGVQTCDMSITEFIYLPKVHSKDRVPVNHDHIPNREEVSRCIIYRV